MVCGADGGNEFFRIPKKRRRRKGETFCAKIPGDPPDRSFSQKFAKITEVQSAREPFDVWTPVARIHRLTRFTEGPVRPATGWKPMLVRR